MQIVFHFLKKKKRKKIFKIKFQIIIYTVYTGTAGQHNVFFFICDKFEQDLSLSVIYRRTIPLMMEKQLGLYLRRLIAQQINKQRRIAWLPSKQRLVTRQSRQKRTSNNYSMSIVVYHILCTVKRIIQNCTVIVLEYFYYMYVCTY